MTKDEALLLIIPLAYGLIERMYMPDLVPETYRNWEHEIELTMGAFKNFVIANPSANRVSALIRAVGQFDFWRLRNISELKEATIDEALCFIVERAKDLELGQSFMTASFNL